MDRARGALAAIPPDRNRVGDLARVEVRNDEVRPEAPPKRVGEAARNAEVTLAVGR